MHEARSIVRKVRSLAPGLLVLLAAGCTAEAAGDGLPVRPADGSDFTPDAGPPAFTNWAALPLLTRGQYRMFTSYDRDDDSSYPLVDPGNKDFNNFLAICGVDLPIALQKSDDSASCAPSLQGFVIASDDNGPGVVSRTLFAVGTVDPLSGADVTFADERVRIYTDDLGAPIYDGKLSDWRNGTAAPFFPPLTTWTSGSLVSYQPISYRSKVRVLVDNLSTTSAYYYRVELISGTEPSDFAVRNVTPADIARTAETFREQARRTSGKTVWAQQPYTLPAGAVTDLFDVTGPGTIDVLHLTIDSADLADLGALTLSLQWDDQAEPAVDLPLSRLFGQEQALANFDTLPMTVRVDGAQTDLTLSLPMPFSRRAHAIVTNRTAKSLAMRAEIVGSAAVPSGEWGYLHATWTEQTDGFSAAGRYAVADVQGRGKYVGTMMFVKGRAASDTSIPSPFNFLEGDDRTIVDGVASKGTGTEDVFDGGWYFIDGRYDRPFTALIAKGTDPDADIGSVSMVRWNVLSNAIPFQESFRLEFEYGANLPDTASSYASVAFYYLR
jgi:hypothetical protein